MLTLLEPPGAKHAASGANRSAQHLLNLGAPDDEDYYEEGYDPSELPSTRRNFITDFLDRYLVWSSSADDYSDRWKKEFRQRPSFCDADLCLQQIKRGKARGNKGALYSRSFIQKALNTLGNFVQQNAISVIVLIVILFSICCYGLQFVHIETDIVKLWVAKGGRLDEELNFLQRVQEHSKYNESNNSGAEIPRENGLGGGYQVVIQTPEYEGQNVLNQGPLLKHVDIMREIANYSVEVGGVQWSLSDICFKPAPPELPKNSIASGMADLIDRIVPCIWITPIDCFWEGSKALGPHPALSQRELGMLSILSSIPSGDVTWKNFDPMNVISEIHGFFSLGTHYTFFERTGISHGYLNRPCLNPLDVECPSKSPNFFDHCPYLDAFIDYAELNNLELNPEKEDNTAGFDIFSLFGSRKKRDSEGNIENTKISEEEQPGNPSLESSTVISTSMTTVTTTSSNITVLSPAMLRKEKGKRCESYKKAMFEWMENNKNKWREFMKETDWPKYPDIAKTMSGGCPGFASGVLHWPKDMILGGAKSLAKEEDLTTADALQSVFLVASPNDVYLRFKQKEGRTSQKPGLNTSSWDAQVAQQVITAWQRNFTKSLYGHKYNTDSDGNGRRTIHPLASTSIADMLEEFCQFNYTIIFVGYGLMLVYAVITQLRRDGCLPAAHSCMGLAFAGVLTVTFASVAGLGLATWFSIEFNAATTQIVPFLTLGIGVDNMFMLLHNYHDVVLMTGRNELGMLMRETGMSILCTSINNILSFLAGTMLPIPALRSFCAQSSILLTFNFISILTLYPALISLDLRRRKSGKRDLLCCIYTETSDESYSMITKPAVQEKKTVGAEPTAYRNLISRPDKDIDDDEPIPYSLHAAIRNFYIPFIEKKSTKIMVVIGSLGLILAAIIGMQQASIGLELSDVLPEHTAPAAFLKARDQYFSFYPMFAVIKGPHIDYARQQHQIDNYRMSVGRSKYVIKDSKNEPSEKYWLQMMRDWLLSIQVAYDKAVEDGKFNMTSGEIIGAGPGQRGQIKLLSEDALIAYRLICSYGNTYNCAGRVGIKRLVDSSNTINYDGFYNYLTAWYNQDNMMYYVSQASFFPSPPKWSIDDASSLLVPPAVPLAYSQIPFYLTGLTDTPVIIDMIKDIRGVCDNFTVAGLPNFPQGIAFTFWEQYLHLSGNLTQAISIIALAVFVVISVLLFNPWAAFSVLVILIAMTVELAGFMGWAGVKMNPVSAVTLITAVGIGVEFTAHVVLAYLTALGNRQQRTHAAVDRVFVPVIHGALSTLLGILMLGFSEFEFVVKYFFVVMSALIVIGLVNGLMLLPVLLSLCGPPTEVTPSDGKTRLSLPPPLRRRRDMINEAEEDEESGGLAMMFPSRTRTIAPVGPPQLAL